MRHLDPTKTRAITFDFRGHRESDKPEDGYSEKQFVQDALAAVNASDSRQCRGCALFATLAFRAAAIQNVGANGAPKNRRGESVMQKLLIASVFTFAAVAALLQAQGRGGAGPAGGRAGTVERIVVHGKALEGNLAGDSPDRQVTVFLPPSHGTDKTRRFPVVYLLHGFGARDDMFIARANLAESANRLAAAQGFSESIIVMPNAVTLHGGSMYSNSVTTGDWEAFIAEDLVGYIDGHYRTIPARISRGLAGHSTGGYGALRIGMKRPDVFSSLYIMSAALVRAESNLPLEAAAAAAEAIRTRAQAEEAARAEEGRAAAFGPSLILALAAAWSPNANNPPFYLDLPVRDGKVRPDIAARWAANSALTMIENHVAGLDRYYGIAIDVGNKDPLAASNRQLHEAMMRLRIPHSYEEYDGDQTSRLAERIERNLLPFFSRNLASPANPTSPSVQD